MEVAAFMADCDGQWPGIWNPGKAADYGHPKDRSLRGLGDEIDGMATENKLMLLKLAASHLEEGEVYVEIGCWLGLTLAAAAHGNPGARIFACDDFSHSQSDSARLRDTIAKHTQPGQVAFYEMDFRRFLRLAPWQPARVGAFFYDGSHRFQDHVAALCQIAPWLSGDAVLIVDDTNQQRVRAAHRLLAKRLPGLQLIADIPTPRNASPTWWNGVQIYRHQGSGASAAPLPVGGASFYMQKLFWDGIMFPLIRGAYPIRVWAGKVPGLRRLCRRVRNWMHRLRFGQA